ncbi:dockerin type I domain-containing protein [Sodaliphilus sp.]
MLTNIILGKDTASNYGGRADVDGNGAVDVSDANQVTNIILGK